jgi:CRP-like cAMP-binding protein
MTGRRKICQGASLYHEHDRFKFIYGGQSGSFKSTLALAEGYEQVSSFHMAGEMHDADFQRPRVSPMFLNEILINN